MRCIKMIGTAFYTIYLYQRNSGEYLVTIKHPNETLNWVSKPISQLEKATDLFDVIANNTDGTI